MSTPRLPDVPEPPHPPDPWRSRLRRWRAILAGDPRARRAFWFRKILRRLTSLIAIDTHDLRILAETRDDTIGLGMFESGDWQRALLMEALDTLPEDHGPVFVDVGANVGPTVLYALGSGRFSRGLAIEPHPELLPVLRANVALNEFHDAVEVIPAAAGREAGTLEFEGAARDPRTGRLNMGDSRTVTPEMAPDPRRPRTPVEVRTLDAIVAGAGIAPGEVGLVWMDIQGGEAAALEGARELVAASVPFACELSPPHLRRAGDLERFLELAQDFGRVVLLGEGGKTYAPAGLPVLVDERPADAILDLLLLP